MSDAAVAPAPTEPKPPTEVEDSKPAATETPSSPTSVEHRYERSGTNADDDYDDTGKNYEEDEEEGAKEEDALFSTIEMEQEAQDLPEQPDEVTAAPRLLQKALTDGEVKETDSDEEKKDNGEVVEQPADTAESGEHHVHKRVSTTMIH